MIRLGLTGGIGSGKSTVASLLAACGAVVIDADAISRATTATGGAAIAQIATEFGPAAITADGAMNRDVIRERAFADPEARLRLEAIIHPLVSLEAARQTIQAQLAGCRLLVFDIPLLVESKRWRAQLGRVLVIDCDEALQVSRVVARSGWTPDAVQKVMAQQASRGQRLAAADFVIYNQTLSLTELATQVQQMAEHATL